MASRYPVLRTAMAARPTDGGAPTIDDVATAAVEGKGSGRPIDGGVAGQVGAHLGADFSGVAVHDDPLSQQATAAMGARAFAYGGDVFLGPHESDRDLGLMAHELTHVAQQGAAGRRAPQRQVQVGAADSPAEREADAVAGQVTSGTGRAAGLLVDEGPLQPGQMLKSTFLEELRAQVTAATSAELGPLWSLTSCSYIDTYLARYAGRPAADGEAFVRRYAPAAAGATSAAAMIPALVERIRAGMQQWRDTGEAPADLPADVPAAAGGPAAAAMGPGQAMDGATAGRMSDAIGDDVAGARIHVGPEAAALAASQGALAVTVGDDIAFASGAYRPGTVEGDALLAHELGHVAQQKGATGAPAGEAGAEAEADADQTAAGAMARLWGGVKGVASRASAAFKSDLSVARCSGGGQRQAADLTRVPAGNARDAATQLAASRETIDRNTAQQLSTGVLAVYYIEDLPHSADEAQILRDNGRDPASWHVLVHPITHGNMILQKNADGFAQDGAVFGLRSLSVDRWKSTLVHEVNHARNPDTPHGTLDRYKSEFRAYWVSEFRGVADLDERARQIKAHILASYPDLAALYNSNAGAHAAIDAHTRPDGNTDNH